MATIEAPKLTKNTPPSRTYSLRLSISRTTMSTPKIPEVDLQTQIPEERRHRRIETGQLVEIFTKTSDVVAILHDISESGASATLDIGHDLATGQNVVVRLLDGTHIRSEIVWNKADTVGLHFYDYIADPDEHVFLEANAFNYYRNVVRLQHKARSQSKKEIR